ncbi:unnamed protein product, partial [Ectocarpus sp. 12 AP-2014]
ISTTQTKHDPWACLPFSLWLGDAMTRMSAGLVLLAQAATFGANHAFSVSSGSSSSARVHHELSRHRPPKPFLAAEACLQRWCSHKCKARVVAGGAAGVSMSWCCRTRPSRGSSRLTASVGAVAAAAVGGVGSGPRSAWESSGISGDSGVDQTEQSEAQRGPSVKTQMMEILRPDLPRISVSVLWAALGTVAALAAPLAYARIV